MSLNNNHPTQQWLLIAPEKLPDLGVQHQASITQKYL